MATANIIEKWRAKAEKWRIETHRNTEREVEETRTGIDEDGTRRKEKRKRKRRDLCIVNLEKSKSTTIVEMKRGERQKANKNHEM